MREKFEDGNNCKSYETAYLSELYYMKRTIKSIDVAMFPVDARLPAM